MFNRKLETALALLLVSAAAVGCAGKRGRAPKAQKADGDAPSNVVDPNAAKKIAIKAELLGAWDTACAQDEHGKSHRTRVALNADGTASRELLTYVGADCQDEAKSESIAKASYTVEATRADGAQTIALVYPEAKAENEMVSEKQIVLLVSKDKISMETVTFQNLKDGKVVDADPKEVAAMEKVELDRVVAEKSGEADAEGNPYETE